jgi:hypothetical protein
MAPSNGPPTTGTSPEPDASMASYFTASHSSSESRPAGFGRVAHRVPQPATHGLSVRCLPGRATEGRPCRDAGWEYTRGRCICNGARGVRGAAKLDHGLTTWGLMPVAEIYREVTAGLQPTGWPWPKAGPPDATQSNRRRVPRRSGTGGTVLSDPRVAQVPDPRRGPAGCGEPQVHRLPRTPDTRAPAQGASSSKHSTSRSGMPETPTTVI